MKEPDIFDYFMCIVGGAFVGAGILFLSWFILIDFIGYLLVGGFSISMGGLILWSQLRDGALDIIKRRKEFSQGWEQ